MNCPGRYEHAIPGLRHEARQLGWHSSVGDGLAQVLLAAASFQAGVHASLGSFRKHYPGFVLSGVASRNELLVGIRWMHLDREPLCHIEELQQQRETTEVSGMSAQQSLTRLIQQLSDSLALQMSISDNAGMFVAVAQNP